MTRRAKREKIALSEDDKEYLQAMTKSGTASPSISFS